MFFWRLQAALLAAAAAVSADEATATTDSTTTTATGAGTIAVTGTALPELVTETEPCALLCYQAACLDSGCGPGDFGCVCGNPHSLVVKLGLCVGRDCDDEQEFDSGDWIAALCNAYDKKPGSAALASASSLVVAEISAAAATATDNPVPSTGSISNGPGETETATTSAATGTGTAAATATGTASSAAGRQLGWPVLAALAGGVVVAAAVFV